MNTQNMINESRIILSDKINIMKNSYKKLKMTKWSAAFASSAFTMLTFSNDLQAQSQSDTIQFTSAIEAYTIPDCAINIVITTFGAQGGNGSSIDPSVVSGGLAGLGNRVTGQWANLQPGDIIYVNVGGAASNGQGGYNGGGSGIAVSGQNPSGGGGGATDIRFPTDAISDRIQVAGGGGGGGNSAYHFNQASFTGGNGGNGGGNQALYGNLLDGSQGEDVLGDTQLTYPGGGGGTTTGPGTGAPGCQSFLGQAGAMHFGATGGIGGSGSSLQINGVPFRASGGAGGGGYLGGNGGGGGSAGTEDCAGNNIGAGGGGSAGTNYFNGEEPIDFENGVREGHGMVVIQYDIAQETAVLTSSIVPCVSQEVTLDFSPDGGTFTMLQGNSADLTANGVFTPSEEGTYEIVYTITDLCTNQEIADTLTLEVTCDLANLVENESANFVIYPNPAEGTLFVQSLFSLGQVDVYDARGKLIFSTKATSNNHALDVSQLEAGCYFVGIQGSVKRFIVK